MSSTTDSDSRDEYIGTRVTEDFKRRVRIRAAQEGVSVSEYITSVLRDDIEDHGVE